MVTLQTADNVLKSFYLDAVKDSLDVKINPLLAKIQRTSANVVGKDVKKAVRVGMSGGIGAGTETGALPSASEGQFVQLTSTLKNLYGTIEISDKAIRASSTSEGAFVNLLNDEMQSLVKSSAFNLGRMLYGDGNGRFAQITAFDGTTIELTTVAGLVEGMKITFCAHGGSAMNIPARKIVGVDHAQKSIVVDGESLEATSVTEGAWICIQGSLGNELTGLGAIFSDNPIYGVTREKSVMKPYMEDSVGEITENTIQKAIDTIEENSGSKVNFIVCSWGVRRALAEYYKQFKTMLPTMELEGGFTAMNFAGIPIIADRFCPAGTMYLLNTDDFKLHQLCDWQWLEGEDGKILKQVPGKPVYTATLVKYAELMCERPCGQGVLKGIDEA